MKKIISFFALFLFAGIISAQEVLNEPVTPSEEVEKGGEGAPEEAPAAENQESEAQNAPSEAETAPEPVQESPVEDQKQAEPGECKCDCPVCPEIPAETAVGETKRNTETKEGEAESDLKEDKPSKMFYQPSVGIGIGASIFSLRVNNDFDFLLKHTKSGTNVYMGLEIDFRYSPYLDDHSVYEIPLQVNFLFDFPVYHRTIKRLALWFSAGVDLAFGYLFYYEYDNDEWNDGKNRDTLFKVMAAWGFGVNMLFKNDVTLKLGFDSFYGKYPDIICAAGYRF